MICTRLNERISNHLSELNNSLAFKSYRCFSNLNIFKYRRVMFCVLLVSVYVKMNGQCSMCIIQLGNWTGLNHLPLSLIMRIVQQQH